MNSQALIPLILLTGLLSACGGSSSSDDGLQQKPADSEAQQPEPEPEPEPEEVQIIELQVIEHTAVGSSGLSLGTNFSDSGSVVKLQSKGFPNQILKLVDGVGNELTNSADIEALFDLFIDPKTGQVEIQLKQVLDFEMVNAPYTLTIKLGAENKVANVTVFDIQNGTEDEPLVVSSYGELKSIFQQGKFVSEDIGNDVFAANLPTSRQNDTGIGESGITDAGAKQGLYVALDRDIDASESANNPWIKFDHLGHIDGRSYVINKLTSNGFSQSESRFSSSRIQDLGFTNAKIINSSTFIKTDHYLQRVFVEGIFSPAENINVDFTPFIVSGSIDNIYANIFYDLSTVQGSSLGNNRLEIGGLFSNANSYLTLNSGYSNGAFSPLAVNGGKTTRIAGISKDQITWNGVGTSVNESSVYSALALNFWAANTNGSTDHRYSGLSRANSTYPDNIKSTSLAASSSDYAWRFVSNRSQASQSLDYGNYNRDNDVNSNLNETGPDLSAAKITEAELLQAASFSGQWLNSHFDIQNGEYPVLKDMPYPHEQDALWMGTEDPGVVYQRATYNDYQNKLN
jgi:hypothetical protein